MWRTTPPNVCRKHACFKHRGYAISLCYCSKKCHSSKIVSELVYLDVSRVCRGCSAGMGTLRNCLLYSNGFVHPCCHHRTPAPRKEMLAVALDNASKKVPQSTHRQLLRAASVISAQWLSPVYSWSSQTRDPRELFLLFLSTHASCAADSLPLTAQAGCLQTIGVARIYRVYLGTI